MPQVLLLFDVDGTLLLTGGASSRAIQTACRALWGDRFVWQDVIAGNLDPDIFRELAHCSGVANADNALPRYQQLYMEALRDELARGAANVSALPGIQSLLQALAPRTDVVLGLLTGNFAAATRLKLLAAGIDPALFRVSAFGEDAHTRAALVQVAQARFRGLCGRACATRHILIIGDTPRDIEAARTAGCRVAAVATGRYKLAQLGALQPDLAVADLHDPRPLESMVQQMLSVT